MSRQKFDEYIQLIRSEDAMTFEDGYLELQNYLNIAEEFRLQNPREDFL